MKKILLSLVLTGFSLSTIGQTNQIGLTGGINSTLSWDGKPALGEGSPYDAKLGYSINLSYSYAFENNITLSLRNSLTLINLQSDDFWSSIDENGNPNYVDKVASQYYYQLSLGGGYLFELGQRYSLGVEIGASMLYNYKQVIYTVGRPETKSETKWPWDKRNRYYGVFLSLDNKYELYSTRKHSLYIIGAVRATQVFNYGYSDSGLNRILPELTLGVAMSFGKPRGRRF